MADIIINNDKCDNCGDCADVCPMEVLILEDEKLTINEPDECSYCESCADICPNAVSYTHLTLPTNSRV